MAGADPEAAAVPETAGPGEESEAAISRKPGLSATRGRLKEIARSAGTLAEKRGRLKQTADALRAFAGRQWRRSRGAGRGDDTANGDDTAT